MRRKPLPPIPASHPDGIFLFDRETRQDVFITYDQLSEMCAAVQAAPDHLVGKPSYQSDPTYNLRRPKQ